MIFEHKTYADDETGFVIHAKTPFCPDVPLDDRPTTQYFGVCECEIDDGGFATDEFSIPGDSLTEAFENFPQAYGEKHEEMSRVIAEQKRKMKQQQAKPKIIRASGDVRRFR